jgi:hypothetical protein
VDEIVDKAMEAGGKPSMKQWCRTLTSFIQNGFFVENEENPLGNLQEKRSSGRIGVCSLWKCVMVHIGHANTIL